MTIRVTRSQSAERRRRRRMPSPRSTSSLACSSPQRGIAQASYNSPALFAIAAEKRGARNPSVIGLSARPRSNAGHVQLGLDPPELLALSHGDEDVARFQTDIRLRI